MIIWKKINSNYNFKKKSAFNSKKWLSIINKILKNNFQSLDGNKYLDQFLASTPLPLMLINDKKKKIKILDFGSGSQELFFQITKMKINKKIEIDSIEVEELTKILKKNKFNNKNVILKFYEKIDFKKKYDYIHISDSLQYISEWQEFLKKINSSGAKLIIFNSLNTGNIKTYLTKQTFYNSELPNIFFSSKKILSLMNKYHLVYKSYFLSKINGIYRELPQPNFYKKDRIKFPKTFILQKI